ncbi:MAG: hypothetical protein ABIH03_03715, partial [Pseudomonadota bacterium]
AVVSTSAHGSTRPASACARSCVRSCGRIVLLPCEAGLHVPLLTGLPASNLLLLGRGTFPRIDRVGVHTAIILPDRDAH